MMDTQKRTVEQRELRVVVQCVEVLADNHTGMDIDKMEHDSIELEVLDVAEAVSG
jgi:hypothetical protein